ncbi:curli-like amyloid fiber formation chaperone CsgH [Pseudomonas sp. NPDC007930]|uniref:curli-like amyloid fiber formation chaperone CsgH n=1 Tax=Pseudomonas sp. NPDC007930 TaxID=3364417 RepID=UPI0036ED7D67
MIDYSHLAVFIDSQRDGAAVIIRPRLANPQPLALRYRMTVTQQSSAGTSNIAQGGELRSDASAGSVRLSVPAGATCQVHLEVFDEDRLIKALEAPCEGG